MTTTKVTEIVILDTPLKRGEQTITSVTLRKPSAGELRGTNLQDLVTLDVNALTKVLPRISQPTLTEQEVRDLDPADLVQLGTAFAGFLAPKAALAQLASPLCVEDAMADLAVVFHWPPQAMYEFSLPELMEWRERARERQESDQ